MKNEASNQSKISGSRLMSKWVMALCAAVAVATVENASAQYQISTVNEVVSENFNGLSVAGTGTVTGVTFNAGVGNTTQAQRNSAWTLTSSNGRGNDNGSNTAGGWRAYGIGNSGNAQFNSPTLGVLGNAGLSSLNSTATFVNTSGGTITSLLVSYTGRQFRGNTGSGSIEVYYSVNGGAFTSLAGSTYTASTTTVGSTNGYSAGNFSDVNNLNIDLSGAGLNLTNGQNIQLQFRYTVGSNSKGVSIDDLTVAFSGTSGGGGGATLSWGASGGGGTSTWDTTTANWYDGSTAVVWDSTKTAVFAGSAGTVTVASGGISAGNGLQFDTSGYTISGDTLTLSGTTSAQTTVTVNTGSATIASALAGSSGVTKSGPGKLILSGNNSGLSGGVSVTSGVLAVTSTAALGSNTLGLSGGTFSSADATALSIANTVVITGDVGLGEASTGNLTFTGSVGLGGGTRVLTVGSGVTTTLAGQYGNGGITKAGAGSLVVASSGSLSTLGVSSGTATINNGITLTLTTSPVAASGGALAIGGTLIYTGATSWAAPVGTITIANGGTYVHNTSAGISSLLGSANFIQETGSTFIYRDASTPSVSGRTYYNLGFETASAWSTGALSGAGVLTVNGALTVASGVTVNFAANTLTTNLNGSVNVSGTYGGGAGARSFTIGSGDTLTVATGGAVILESGQSVTIASGGTLTGGGSITGGTVNVDGGLNPGSSPGVLTVSTLVLGNTAQTVMEVQGTSPGVSFDVVQGTTLTFGGDLELSLTGLSYLGTTLTLFDFSTYNVGLNAINLTGQFTLALNNLGAGAWSNSFVVNDVGTYNFTFSETSGEFLATFTAVPEPSTYVLFALGAGIVLWRLRRRTV
ncbi:MAG TPA: PEP-CTERM sorting domain-containing protein [Terrimicrobiaceae bacterium]|nr:PEP-CTERM sorting domain-containing protein [Terrimicrobiaceae bacterium]